MLLWAPLVWVQVPSSFAQSLFDRPPTRVMIHNPESPKACAIAPRLRLWFLRMLVMPWARLFCGSCPILIGGIGAAWSLGFISAIIPFAAKEHEDWPGLLSQALKRI